MKSIEIDKLVTSAQNKWAKYVIDIGSQNTEGTEIKILMNKFLEDLYAFKITEVLFKPTKASSNQFRKTKEDFIYYILFTLEQLELNPEETMVTLLGDIDTTSDNYKFLYAYVRNINFLNSKNAIFNSQDTITKHSNFILLG